MARVSEPPLMQAGLFDFEVAGFIWWHLFTCEQTASHSHVTAGPWGVRPAGRWPPGAKALLKKQLGPGRWLPSGSLFPSFHVQSSAPHKPHSQPGSRVSTHIPSRERHVKAFWQEFASMQQKDIPAPVCSHLPRGEYFGKKASLLIKSKCVTLNTSSQLQECSPLAVLLKGCLLY